MASFQDAFHKGLEAYESADRARREILSVFEECAKQVSTASGGAIVLSREPKSRGTEGQESYQALMARPMGAPETMGLELGEYKLSPHGYPVSLVYAGVDEYCHDKPSLEQALVELLGHPVTGGKLRRLMDLHAKRKSLTGGTPPQTDGGQNGKAE